MFLIGMLAKFRQITATTAPLDPVGAHRLHDRTDHGIDCAAGDDAAQRDPDVGIGSLAGIGGGGDDDADEGEARTQVAGHLAAGDEEEHQGADPAHEDGDVGVESHEDGREHGGAEHCDHVLHAHGRGLRPGQPLVRPDDAALRQHRRGFFSPVEHSHLALLLLMCRDARGNAGGAQALARPPMRPRQIPCAGLIPLCGTTAPR